MCAYHGLDALDPNIQGLLLLQELFQVLLSRLQSLAVLGLRHFDVFKLWREREDGETPLKNNTQRKPRLLGWHLILVPVFGVLQILFGHFVVLVTDVVEHVAQVGVVGIDLHLHLGVSDLLTQVIHLLEEAQRG